MELLLVEVLFRDVSDFFAAARNAFATTDFPVLFTELVEGVEVEVDACFWAIAAANAFFLVKLDPGLELLTDTLSEADGGSSCVGFREGAGLGAGAAWSAGLEASLFTGVDFTVGGGDMRSR